MVAWVESLHPIWQALIRVLLLVLPVLLMVPGAIWYERRLLGWFQDRIGPNRVGNITVSRRNRFAPDFLKGRKFNLFGLIQPIADGIKLFIKEDLMPAKADRLIFVAAPALALFPAFTLGATIPWGPIQALTPVADVNVGLLYILAISSLGVYGVVLSGYASNNKYSLLGGLRSSAQLISYELGMGLALGSIVLAVGSLKMTDMVRAQEGPLWGFVGPLANWHLFTPYGFLAAIIFFICMVAETNRAPFDLPEAENELVAGYHTEYSSMKFAVFFMGEYAAMLVYGGIFMTVFAGGWHLVPIRWDWIAEQAPPLAYLAGGFATWDYWLAPLTMIAKCVLVLTVYIWLRATLPRLRYDQLMALGWKSLMPLAVANLILVAAWILVERLTGNPFYGFLFLLVGVGLVVLFYRQFRSVLRGPGSDLPRREVELVNYAKPASSETSEGVPA
jgi:NADH-quinone oxidoreductase subunit H